MAAVLAPKLPSEVAGLISSNCVAAKFFFAAVGGERLVRTLLHGHGCHGSLVTIGPAQIAGRRPPRSRRRRHRQRGMARQHRSQERHLRLRHGQLIAQPRNLPVQLRHHCLKRHQPPNWPPPSWIATAAVVADRVLASISPAALVDGGARGDHCREQAARARVRDKRNYPSLPHVVADAHATRLGQNKRLRAHIGPHDVPKAFSYTSKTPHPQTPRN